MWVTRRRDGKIERKNKTAGGGGKWTGEKYWTDRGHTRNRKIERKIERLVEEVNEIENLKKKKNKTFEGGKLSLKD